MRKLKRYRIGRVKDGIANRTRLRLGSVMNKTKPIQHPHCWPLLKAIQDKRSWSEIIRTRMLKENKHREPCNVSDRSCIRKNTVKDKSIRRAALNRTRRKRRQYSRKPYLRSSQIQVVTIGKIQNRKRTRRRTRNRRTYNRRNRKSGKKTRKRRKRTQEGAVKNKTAKRTPLRRKGGSSRKREQDTMVRYSRRRRKKLQYDYSLLNDYDLAFSPQAAFESDNRDVGIHDVKNNPLNVGGLCRLFVNSVPGIPADDRNIPPIIKKHTPKSGKFKRKTAIRKSLNHSEHGKKYININAKGSTKSSCNRVKRVCHDRRIKAVAHRKKITKVGDFKTARNMLCEIQRNLDEKGRKPIHKTTAKNKLRLRPRASSSCQAGYHRYHFGVRRSSTTSRLRRQKL